MGIFTNLICSLCLRESCVERLEQKEIGVDRKANEGTEGMINRKPRVRQTIAEPKKDHVPK